MNAARILLAVAALSLFAAFPAAGSELLPVAGDPAATRAAVQAAIDTAANASPAGTVDLAAGLFEIDAQLMVTGGVHVVGQGWGRTALRQTAAGQRVATLRDGSALEGVTVTGGRLSASWQHGAGVLVEDGTVSWCCVSNNVSTGRNVYGGGVSVSKGTVDHCLVAFNQAGTYTSSGGGIGAYNHYNAVLIDSCLVYGNRASVTDGGPDGNGGGGIGFFMGDPAVTVRNTTIAGNSAGERGGGIRVSGTKATLLNCIVAGNSAGTDADLSGTPASGSSGNFVGADPADLFVDAVDGDYHLDAESPAVRAGAAYAGIGKDLDGSDFASPPSAGCYEFTGELRVVRPVFGPASGVTFSPSLDVSLSCRTDGAAIYYTTDGTDPTEADALYAAPIRLESGTTTIRARAFKEGMAPSRIVEAVYTRGDPAPPVLGDVAVTPMVTMAGFHGAIESIGNNVATACEVWIAVGTRSGRLGERVLAASGATTSFDCVVSGLSADTTYYYELTVVNDAQTPLDASVRGQFATLQGIQPVAGDPAATRSLIQAEIDAAARMEPAGTVGLGAGLFEIDAQLMVTNGVTLVGRGWELTTIRQTANARCATVSGGAKLQGLTLAGGRIREKWQSGAGVLVENGTVSWCCITNNRIGDASWQGIVVNNNSGAGAHVKQGSVDHTIFACNTAYANGGGSSHGGGLGVESPTGPILVDTCLFHGNRAPNGNGGAVYAQFQNNHHLLTVRNTTVSTNEASGSGGGVYVSQNGTAADFALVDAILADNVSGGEGADPNLSLPAALLPAYAAQSFGNVFANATPALGEGSKSFAGSGRNWFVKASRGNFRLQSGSPPVGSGRWFEGIAEDLDGLRRLKKPAAGCYETQFCTIMVLR